MKRLVPAVTLAAISVMLVGPGRADAGAAVTGGFSITPTRGPAGTEITVSSVTSCSSGGGSVTVSLEYPNKPGEDFVVGDTETVAVDGDGSWELEVGSGAAGHAGPLSLDAACSGDRAPDYAPRTFTITTRGRGYWLRASTPQPFPCICGPGFFLATTAAFGDAAGLFDAGSLSISAPTVGLAPNPRTGAGFWEVAADGGVFAFDAPFHGSLGGLPLAAPIVGIAAMPGGGGYWLVAADGGVFAFGNAIYHGSLGGTPLAAPIVGMAVTPDGGGYWLLAADGGVFAFGNARYLGSAHGLTGSRVVGMAADRQGDGYWLADEAGAVFTFGRAAFHGNVWGIEGRAPVVGIAGDPTGEGYWLAGNDGGVFAFGHAGFFGSDAGSGRQSVGIVATPDTTA